MSNDMSAVWGKTISLALLLLFFFTSSAYAVTFHADGTITYHNTQLDADLTASPTTSSQCTTNGVNPPSNGPNAGDVCKLDTSDKPNNCENGIFQCFSTNIFFGNVFTWACGYGNPLIGKACSNFQGVCEQDGKLVCETPTDGTQIRCQTAPSPKPGVEEKTCDPKDPTCSWCNNLDDDCDGTVDDFVAVCGDTECKIGKLSCTTDLQMICDGIYKEPEICDGKDSDCDGVIDDNAEGTGVECGLEDLGVVFIDGPDGGNIPAGECKFGSTQCAPDLFSGKVSLACIGAVKPKAEQCDGKDNDCNNIIDDVPSISCYSGPAGTSGVGACHAGAKACVNGAISACTGEVVPTAEICNGIDDNCDGQTDEEMDALCESTSGGNTVCNGTSICKGIDGCQSSTPLNCDDGKPCTQDRCDKTSGCFNPTDNNLACNDGNICTRTDKCVEGTCVGGNLDACSDSNPCTDDSCNPVIGCVFANDDSNQCEDGNVCNGTSQCKDGVCRDGVDKKCDDGNPCTTDTCTAGHDCVFTNNNSLSCNDGNACTNNDLCVDGACFSGDTITCDDENPCTADSCITTSGACENQPLVSVGENKAECWETNEWCNTDSTAGDICRFKEPVCTVIVCDEDSKLVQSEIDEQPPVPFRVLYLDKETFSSLTPDEISDIKAGSCKELADNPEVDPVIPPTIKCVISNKIDIFEIFNLSPSGAGDLRALNDDLSFPYFVGSTIADEFTATTGDWVINCSVKMDFASAPECFADYQVVACSSDSHCVDEDPCTIDTCNPGGACEHAAKTCNSPPANECVLTNSKVYTADGICNDETGLCEYGSSFVACDDGNECTDDICTNGACVNQGIQGKACNNDGNLCTFEICASGGSCSGAPVPGVQCNSDTSCIDDSCNVQTGKCVQTPTSAEGCCKTNADCNDDNICTTDICNVETGACSKINAANVSACDDKNVCTTSDTCTAGQCVGSVIVCDDGNPCTDETCDETKGCEFRPNTNPCDDTNACTIDDVCKAGTCAGTNNPDCEPTKEDEKCPDGTTPVNATLVGVAPVPEQACLFPLPEGGPGIQLLNCPHEINSAGKTIGGVQWCKACGNQDMVCLLQHNLLYRFDSKGGVTELNPTGALQFMPDGACRASPDWGQNTDKFAFVIEDTGNPAIAKIKLVYDSGSVQEITFAGETPDFLANIFSLEMEWVDQKPVLYAATSGVVYKLTLDTAGNSFVVSSTSVLYEINTILFGITSIHLEGEDIFVQAVTKTEAHYLTIKVNKNADTVESGPAELVTLLNNRFFLSAYPYKVYDFALRQVQIVNADGTVTAVGNFTDQPKYLTEAKGICPASYDLEGNPDVIAPPTEPDPEVCDGIDNDLDGLTDEGDVCPKTGCSEGDKISCGKNLLPPCSPGFQECLDGVFGPCTGAIGPKKEICNDSDDDCDGIIDDGDVCDEPKPCHQDEGCGCCPTCEEKPVIEIKFPDFKFPVQPPAETESESETESETESEPKVEQPIIDEIPAPDPSGRKLIGSGLFGGCGLNRAYATTPTAYSIWLLILLPLVLSHFFAKLPGND